MSANTNVIRPPLKISLNFPCLGNCRLGFLYQVCKGAHIKNIGLVNKKENYSASLLLNDVETIRLEKISISGPVSKTVIFMNAARYLTLRKIKVPGRKRSSIKINKARSQ